MTTEADARMKKPEHKQAWILLAACAAALLAACGQKGPLYLPDENGTVVTRPGTQPAPSQKPDSEEEGTNGDKRPQQRTP